MHALVHTLSAIAVLPYAVLAALFLLIGEAARTRGVLALVDLAAQHAYWILRWGLYGFAVFWISLVAMGFVTRFQRFGSLSLAVLALVSFTLIVTLHSPRIGLGQLLFLAPCLGVAIASGCLFVRAGGV